MKEERIINELAQNIQMSVDQSLFRTVMSEISDAASIFFEEPENIVEFIKILNKNMWPAISEMLKNYHELEDMLIQQKITDLKPITLCNEYELLKDYHITEKDVQNMYNDLNKN